VKGAVIIIEALILVVIAIALSVLIGNWLYSVSKEKTESIKNTTSKQLKCEFGNMYIKSAKYNCLNSCEVGGLHNLTVDIVNSGKISVFMDRIFIQNKTGTVFSLDLNETISIDPGAARIVTNISTDSCHGINNTVDKVVVNSLNCPNTAFDSVPGNYVEFINC